MSYFENINTQGYGEAVECASTRPNDVLAYATNDVIGTIAASNMEFVNVVPSARSVIITGAYMRIKTASVPTGMGNFRLHLYNAAPTPIADNVAFTVIDADRSKYLGYILLYLPEKIGDNLLWTQVENINMERYLPSTSIFAVLQTLSGYTPTANGVKEIGLCVLGR